MNKIIIFSISAAAADAAACLFRLCLGGGIIGSFLSFFLFLFVSKPTTSLEDPTSSKRFQYPNIPSGVVHKLADPRKR